MRLKHKILTISCGFLLATSIFLGLNTFASEENIRNFTDKEIEDIYKGKIPFKDGKIDIHFLNNKLSINGDTDKDGIKDIDEVKIEEIEGRKYLHLISNPFLKDTDGDGIIDSEDKNKLSWDISVRDMLLFQELVYRDPDYIKDVLTYPRNSELKEYENRREYTVMSNELAPFWELKEFISKPGGFDAAIFTYKNKIDTSNKYGEVNIVAMRGTKGSEDIATDLKIGVGGQKTQQHIDAVELANRLKKEGLKNIYVCGHSLGGYLAGVFSAESYRIGNKEVKHTYTFNGLRVKTGLFSSKDQKELASIMDNHITPEKLITSYQCSVDPVISLWNRYSERINLPGGGHSSRSFYDDGYQNQPGFNVGSRVGFTDKTMNPSYLKDMGYTIDKETPLTVWNKNVSDIEVVRNEVLTKEMVFSAISDYANGTKLELLDNNLNITDVIGDKKVKVKLTYPDSSSEDVVVNVKVKSNMSDNNELRLTLVRTQLNKQVTIGEVKSLLLKENENNEKAVNFKDDLERLEFVDKDNMPDVSKSGKTTDLKVKVFYKDKSSEILNLPYYIDKVNLEVRDAVLVDGDTLADDKSYLINPDEYEDLHIQVGEKVFESEENNVKKYNRTYKYSYIDSGLKKEGTLLQNITVLPKVITKNYTTLWGSKDIPVNNFIENLDSINNVAEISAENLPDIINEGQDVNIVVNYTNYGIVRKYVTHLDILSLNTTDISTKDREIVINQDIPLPISYIDDNNLIKDAKYVSYPEKVLGTREVNIELTFIDGSKKNVSAKLNIIDTLANTTNIKIDELNIKQYSNLDYDIIKSCVKSNDVEVVITSELPDTKVAGSYEVLAILNYKDSSTKEIKLTINVEPIKERLNKLEIVEGDNVPSVDDFVANKSEIGANDIKIDKISTKVGENIVKINFKYGKEIVTRETVLKVYPTLIFKDNISKEVGSILEPLDVIENLNVLSDYDILFNDLNYDEGKHSAKVVVKYSNNINRSYIFNYEIYKKYDFGKQTVGDVFVEDIASLINTNKKLVVKEINTPNIRKILNLDDTYFVKEYDIKILDEVSGEIFEPKNDDRIRIGIKIPKDLDKHKCKLYHKVLGEYVLEDAKVSDGYLISDVTHFSEFVLVVENVKEHKEVINKITETKEHKKVINKKIENKNKEHKKLPNTYVGSENYIILILAFVLCNILIFRKNK